MALIPFALFYYGPAIRARSHFGKRLARMAEEAAERKAREQELEMAESQPVGEADLTQGSETSRSEAEKKES
jgi:hypothetical protein